MKLISLEDLVKAAVTPAFIVDGILPERSVFLLSGEPYSGKSLLAMDLALAVASAGKFLGRQARLGRVLFIGKDSPRWDYAQQAKKLCTGRALAVHEVEGFWFTTPGFERALHTDEAAQALVALLHEVHADVVVMDALRKMHLWDENSSGQMTPVMDRVRMIAESGVSVVLVHHKGKPKEGVEGNYEARGSGVISSESDVHWLLEKRSGGELRVTVGKARAGGIEGAARIKLDRDDALGRVVLELTELGEVQDEEPEDAPKKKRRRRYTRS